jgi:hypothetical protein
MATLSSITSTITVVAVFVVVSCVVSFVDGLCFFRVVCDDDPSKIGTSTMSI